MLSRQVLLTKGSSKTGFVSLGAGIGVLHAMAGQLKGHSVRAAIFAISASLVVIAYLLDVFVLVSTGISAQTRLYPPCCTFLVA